MNIGAGPSGDVGVVQAGHDGGDPEFARAVGGVVLVYSAAEFGRRVGRVSGRVPCDVVQVVPIEHLLIGQIHTLGDPECRVRRVYLLAKGGPGGYVVVLLSPEKDHRFAAVAQEGWVLGMGRQQVSQRGDHVSLTGVEGGGELKIHCSVEAPRLRHLQQRAKVSLGLVVLLLRPTPRHDKGIDAGLLRPDDLPLDSGPVAGAVGLHGHIGYLIWRPGIVIVPAVVKGQYQPFFLLCYPFGLAQSRPSLDMAQTGEQRQARDQRDYSEGFHHPSRSRLTLLFGCWFEGLT